jgi:hypothetical protein
MLRDKKSRLTVLNYASVDRDTVTGMIYDRHSYDVEKRRALEWWAERLAEIVEPKTRARQVIKFRPKKAGLRLCIGDAGEAPH